MTCLVLLIYAMMNYISNPVTEVLGSVLVKGSLNFVSNNKSSLRERSVILDYRNRIVCFVNAVHERTTYRSLM